MTGRTDRCIAWLAMQERDVTWDINPHMEPRTHRQNAYYWALLTKVADKMRMSKTECHNRMLRDYGQTFNLVGESPYVMLPDTEEAERDVLRSETFHVRPTSLVKQGRNGGHGYRAYIILRGSSDYNTAEMSALLDGLIQEAKQLDIETLTPDGLSKLREYDKRYEEKRSEKRNTA